jgi:hypothetical protein
MSLDETAYIQGSRMAWLQMFSLCLRELGYDSAEANPHRWIKEREEALQVLRRICAEYGDNEWDEELHLADILDKHLECHL